MERKTRSRIFVILIAAIILSILFCSSCITTPEKKTTTDDKTNGETDKQGSSQKTGNTTAGDKSTGTIGIEDGSGNLKTTTNGKYTQSDYTVSGKSNVSKGDTLPNDIAIDDGFIYALFYGTLFAGIYLAIIISRIRKRKKR